MSLPAGDLHTKLKRATCQKLIKCGRANDSLCWASRGKVKETRVRVISVLEVDKEGNLSEGDKVGLG